MKNIQKRAASRALVATVLLVPGAVLAGTAGTEFASVWTTLVGWIEGTLGQIIAVTFILVGIVAGVAKGSIFGLVVGVAAGLGLITAPTVIDTMFTATLPVSVSQIQPAATAPDASTVDTTVLAARARGPAV